MYRHYVETEVKDNKRIPGIIDQYIVADARFCDSSSNGKYSFYVSTENNYKTEKGIMTNFPTSKTFITDITSMWLPDYCYMDDITKIPTKTPDTINITIQGLQAQSARTHEEPRYFHFELIRNPVDGLYHPHNSRIVFPRPYVIEQLEILFTANGKHILFAPPYVSGELSTVNGADGWVLQADISEYNYFIDYDLIGTKKLEISFLTIDPGLLNVPLTGALLSAPSLSMTTHKSVASSYQKIYLTENLCMKYIVAPAVVANINFTAIIPKAVIKLFMHNRSISEEITNQIISVSS